MNRVYLGVAVVVLVAAGFVHMQPLEPRGKCQACGAPVPDRAYPVAVGYLHEEYPQRNFTVVRRSATIYGCGPCGGTSPTAFRVMEGNQTVGFIAAYEGEVLTFSQDMSKAPANLRMEER